MKHLIFSIFSLFIFHHAYAVEATTTNIDCSHYMATTTEVMQEVQNGKNIKQLIDIALEKKNNAITPEEIQLAKVYAAYTVVAYKEPVGITPEEKQNALNKAAFIGKKLCEKQMK